MIVFCIQCKIPVLSNTSQRNTPAPKADSSCKHLFPLRGCQIPGPDLWNTSSLLPSVGWKLSPKGICVFRPSAWCLVQDQELAEPTNHQQRGWKKIGPSGREHNCSMVQNLDLRSQIMVSHMTSLLTFFSGAQKTHFWAHCVFRFF